MGQVTYFLFPPLFYADKHPFKAKKVPFFEFEKMTQNGHILTQKYVPMCTFFLAWPIWMIFMGKKVQAHIF